MSKDSFHDYMRLLRGAHRDANLANVMCISLISVDYRGFVYDCDFNQMLGIPLVADHCYGCTAGQGSSCCGALA